MTTREEVIAAAKEAGFTWEPIENIIGPLERFYSLAIASRDAEIKGLEASLDLAKHERNNLNETVTKQDAEIAKLKQEHINCVLSIDECEQDYDQLRAELAAALAACKMKDEVLNDIASGCYTSGIRQQARDALAIRPDDTALKAWLGEPIAITMVTPHGTHWTNWKDNPAHGSKLYLYSPKGMK